MAEPDESLELPLTCSRIQLGWASWTSGVSSMVTILDSGEIKAVMALSKVVFPEAVSPAINTFKFSRIMKER